MNVSKNTLKMNQDIWLYYIYAIVRKKCKLNDIDKFLKNTWCECCGHLSEFTIEVNDQFGIHKKSKKIGKNDK